MWACIAKAWANYKDEYLGDRRANDEEAVQGITALTLISMGVTNAAKLKLSPEVAARFIERYTKAWNQGL